MQLGLVCVTLGLEPRWTLWSQTAETSTVVDRKWRFHKQTLTDHVIGCCFDLLVGKSFSLIKRHQHCCQHQSCSQLWSISSSFSVLDMEGYLSCFSCCNTGPRLLRSHLRFAWHKKHTRFTRDILYNPNPNSYGNSEVIYMFWFRIYNLYWKKIPFRSSLTYLRGIGTENDLFKQAY